MKRLEEQDIRGLLESPPAAPPPEDLADLLKAQIPDPLPNWEEDEAAASPEAPAAPRLLKGPWQRIPWTPAGRLAAALVAMVGVGALSLQLLQWSESNLESPAAFDVASQTTESAEPPPDIDRSPQVLADDGIQESVAESKPPVALSAGSDRSEVDDVGAVGAVESTEALPPRRAKKVELPSPQAEVARRLDVPEPSADQEAALDSEVAAAPMAESSQWAQAAPQESASEPAPLPELARRPQVDATQRAARARQSAGSEGLAASRMAPMDLAKRLETSADSSPWATAKLASRFEWQPPDVDAADFDRWRQRFETASSQSLQPRIPSQEGAVALPVDAALMAFGAVSGTPMDAGEMRLQMAPSPTAGSDSTFWLLVESRSFRRDSAEVQVEPALDIEVSPRVVARYQILAEGFDKATGVGRLLMAMELTSPSDESAGDVVVTVRRAPLEAAPREATPQEEIVRRRDLVSSWQTAPWPYRVQTLGVGLVQAPDRSELLPAAEEFRIELRQRPEPAEPKARLESWLQWLTSAAPKDH